MIGGAKRSRGVERVHMARGLELDVVIEHDWFVCIDVPLRGAGYLRPQARARQRMVQIA